MISWTLSLEYQRQNPLLGLLSLKGVEKTILHPHQQFFLFAHGILQDIERLIFLFKKDVYLTAS